MDNIKDLSKKIKNKEVVSKAISELCGITQQSARNNYLSNSYAVPAQHLSDVIDILQKQFVFEQEMQRQENELHNINVDYELIKGK